MSWQTTWLRIQSRPRVLHQLPGRLRVHIPALKSVSVMFSSIVDFLLQEFKLPAGIISAKINYISGNVLIYYDVKKTCEKDVLDWLQDLRHLSVEISGYFLDLSGPEIETKGRRLLDFFKEASDNGNSLDKHLEIPHEIWSK